MTDNKPDPIGDPLPVSPRDPRDHFQGLTSSDASTLGNYWSWAHSHLLDNTERGVLAEDIVGLALGCVENRTRLNWDAFDLLYAEKYGVEVKASGYLQNWRQSGPSTISFDIKDHLSFDSASGTTSKDRSRPAQIYVFCVFAENSRTRANPLDLSQWEFLVVSTKRLSRIVGNQKTIRLGPLIERVQPRQCSFAGLKEAVDAEIRLAF